MGEATLEESRHFLEESLRRWNPIERQNMEMGLQSQGDKKTVSFQQCWSFPLVATSR